MMERAIEKRAPQDGAFERVVPVRAQPVESVNLALLVGEDHRNFPGADEPRFTGRNLRRQDQSNERHASKISAL